MTTVSLAGCAPVPPPALIGCSHCGLPLPPRRGPGALFCCFGCRIASELGRPGEGGAPGEGSGTLLFRLGLGIFLGMNIMVFSWLSYADWMWDAGAGDPRAGVVSSLFSYLLLLLTTIVVVTLGGPLLLDSLRLDANLLIVIGAAAAYALSVAHTLSGEPGLYYDTAAVILVLVTLGNYLESRAKRRAVAAAEALLVAAPEQAWVRRGDEVVAVAAASLVPGDRVRARPGEAIPADGLVVEGASHVDESPLTGESRPRPVGPGDPVLAGSVSRDGQLWVEATRVGPERVIAAARRLLAAARRERPAIQRSADRVAALFVPAVVLLALGVLAVHLRAGQPTRGLFDALSVLLISCPCALGLAAPLASHFALHRAAALGVLIDSPATLERAARVRRVFFDKTGTLGEARLELCGIETVPGGSEAAALAEAAAIEAASVHPIAEGLAAAAASRGLAVPPHAEARTHPGLGVSATVAGRRLWLGGSRLLGERGLAWDGAAGDEAQAPEAGLLQLYLMDEERALARFRLRERLRPGAGGAVRALHALGIQVSILTGDAAGAARPLAHALGIGFEAGLLPGDKLERVRRARAAGGTGAIAVVGDGINDAPVLAAADVGFALAGGTALAREAGNVVVLGDRLERIPETLALARHALRSIRLNLLGAFAYNVAGLTLAATGHLSPVFSALAMIGSSLLVLHVSASAGRVAGDPARTAGR